MDGAICISNEFWHVQFMPLERFYPAINRRLGNLLQVSASFGLRQYEYQMLDGK